MKRFLAFVILMWFGDKTYSQSISNKIIGSWDFVGIDGKKKGFVECPDVINFNANGSYTVYNDCYGENPSNPFTERGLWLVDSKLMSGLLKERKFYVNYYFHKRSKFVQFEIKEVTDKALKIHFLDKANLVVEKYVRRKH